MAKKPKKSTVYFDDKTQRDVADIMKWSRIARTQNAVLRGMSDKYAKLLALQVEAESNGRRLLILDASKDYKPDGDTARYLLLDPLDLRL